MQRYNTAYNTGPPPSEASSSRLIHRQTRPAAASTSFKPPNAHDRLQRMHALRQFYENSGGNRLPAKPRSRGELDVLKERHQFVRDSRVDPNSLPWEDQLASKFYDSLFKEYAVVNLKHYKSGAVALRWRTEEEVLSGIGHLTCGSLRCRYHEPPPSLVAAQQQQADDTSSSSIFTTATEVDLAPPLADPDSETPLVEARLEELEMPFGYLEQGVKKSVLVKVVLCRACAKKLKYGRQKAKEIRADKEREHLAGGGATGSPTRDSRVTTGLDSTSAPPPPPSSSKRQRHPHEGRSSPPPPSARPPPAGRSSAAEEEDDDNHFRPNLPPDMDDCHRQQQQRHHHHHHSSSGGGERRRERSSRERRRRSASPLSRRQ